MKPIRKIKIGLERVINLGNYENIKLIASLEETVLASEDLDDAFQRITDDVGAQLKKMETEIVESPDDDDDEDNPFGQ